MTAPKTVKITVLAITKADIKMWLSEKEKTKENINNNNYFTVTLVKINTGANRERVAQSQCSLVSSSPPLPKLDHTHQLPKISHSESLPKVTP